MLGKTPFDFGKGDKSDFAYQSRCRTIPIQFLVLQQKGRCGTRQYDLRFFLLCILVILDLLVRIK